MAGTLTIGTLSDGTNSTSATNCISGSAKAWVNWNSAGTIRAAYNVSSVTRVSTGMFTVNFTNALSDTNYATVATASAFTSGNGTTTGMQLRPASAGSGSTGGAMGANKTTSSVSVQTANYNSTMLDMDDNNVAIFR